MVCVTYGWPHASGRDEADAWVDVFVDMQRVPFQSCRLAALGCQEAAVECVRRRDWAEAFKQWQRFVRCLDRFRDPGIIAVARQAHLKAAVAALNGGLCGLSLRAIGQYLASGDCDADSLEVKRRAESMMSVVLHRAKEAVRTHTLPLSGIGWWIQCALDYRTGELLEILEPLVDRLPDDGEDQSKVALDRANFYLARGQWEQATESLAGRVESDPRAARTVGHLRGLMTFDGPRGRCLLGGVPEQTDCDAARAVSKGFSYLANSCYPDALEWILFGLSKDPADPFGLFAHGLWLWSSGLNALAADRLRLAIDGLEGGHRQRSLGLMRHDETAPPRSYAFNPLYLIYNPRECLSQVLSGRGFVSSMVFP
jgi:tetratricopeptide (TPR) repeat protein